MKLWQAEKQKGVFWRLGPTRALATSGGGALSQGQLGWHGHGAEEDVPGQGSALRALHAGARGWARAHSAGDGPDGRSGRTQVRAQGRARAPPRPGAGRGKADSASGCADVARIPGSSADRRRRGSGTQAGARRARGRRSARSVGARWARGQLGAQGRSADAADTWQRAGAGAGRALGRRPASSAQGRHGRVCGPVQTGASARRGTRGAGASDTARTSGGVARPGSAGAGERAGRIQTRARGQRPGACGQAWARGLSEREF